jgi:NTP pyrophosphatase (non-canonical NTP hydrolase)
MGVLMNENTINNLIKECHEIAVSKGFYDCPDCKGEPIKRPCDHPGCYAHISHPCEQCGRLQGKCPNCNGTGKDPNRNIGELLMLIVSELSEALEAHRKGIFVNCDIDDYIDFSKKYFIPWFEKHIKDTFEDEIADVFIRLFDLCGYLEIKDLIISTAYSELSLSKNIGEHLFKINTFICYSLEDNKSIDLDNISIVVSSLFALCHRLNIDIEKHIKAKMEYNKTRPYKHNKEY